MASKQRIISNGLRSVVVNLPSTAQRDSLLASVVVNDSNVVPPVIVPNKRNTINLLGV